LDDDVVDGYYYYYYYDPGSYEDAVAAPWGTAEVSATVFDRPCELNVE